MSERFLKGRVALVTGGASGMGRAIALELAKAGADVSIGSLLQTEKERTVGGELVHLPGKEHLDEAVEELRAHDVRAMGANLDVTSVDSVARFHEATVAELGEVDVLVNAAGITAEQTITGHPDGLWDKVIDVNLNGPYRTTKVCLPKMMERGWGRIINIASTAATVGAPASVAYCASKAGLVGMSKCVALEGAEKGVTCNTISPGWVETDFGRHWMGHIAETTESRSGDEFIEEAKATNPQGRMIQPSEIGSLAAFLCRDEAIGMTMQDLTVSAGSLW